MLVWTFTAGTANQDAGPGIAYIATHNKRILAEQIYKNYILVRICTWPWSGTMETTQRTASSKLDISVMDVAFF